MTKASKVTGFVFDPDDLTKDLERNLELLKWRDYIKTDSRVFVKPNFTVPFPKPGVTTNELLIEAVLGILKDRASEVYIGESDGGSYSFTAAESLNGHRIPDICKRTGAKLLDLSRSDRIKVTDTVNRKRIDALLPKPLLGMDESISIPVLKVHVVTGVSLSLKNIWGCHPDTLRLYNHCHLSELLALMARSINLRFSIIDAIYGLNRYGPMEGDVVKIGRIIIGNNPVATDALSARMMGFDPAKINHILIASNFGLGSLREEDIEVLGDLSKFEQNFYVEPTFIDRLGALTFKSKLLARVIFGSPLTKPIYKLTGRKYRKKITKLGDEL